MRRLGTHFSAKDGLSEIRLRVLLELFYRLLLDLHALVMVHLQFLDALNSVVHLRLEQDAVYDGDKRFFFGRAVSQRNHDGRQTHREG